MFTVSPMIDWDDSADMSASDHSKEQSLMEEITSLNIDLNNTISEEQADNICKELEIVEEKLEKLRAGELVSGECSGYDNKKGDPFNPPANEET